jgi:hypothetical protein
MANEDKEIDPSTLMKQQIEKFAYDSDSYFFKHLETAADRVCMDKCLTTWKASNIGHREKLCITRCHTAYYNTAMSSWFSMKASNVLKEYEENLSSLPGDRID